MAWCFLKQFDTWDFFFLILHSFFFRFIYLVKYLLYPDVLITALGIILVEKMLSAKSCMCEIRQYFCEKDITTPKQICVPRSQLTCNCRLLRHSFCSLGCFAGVSARNGCSVGAGIMFINRPHLISRLPAIGQVWGNWELYLPREKATSHFWRHLDTV